MIFIYNSTSCPHIVFMCIVWIWEQTAIISLYNINWLIFITETESVYCAVRTGSLYIIQVMCFVWIWEQTAIISLYNINWLVCITETECVYCAVRTGSFIYNSGYVFCVDLRTNSDYFPIQHSLAVLYNRDGVCLLRGTDWVFIYNSGYVFCVDLRTNSDYFPIQH